MLQITREDDFIRVTADPPEKVRLKLAGGHFLPDRAGKTVGSGPAQWLVKTPFDLKVRVQRYDGTNWVDEAG